MAIIPAAPDALFKLHANKSNNTVPTHFNDPNSVKRPTLEPLDTSLPPRGSSLSHPPTPTSSTAPPTANGFHARRPEHLRPAFLNFSAVAPSVRPATSSRTTPHSPVQLLPVADKSRPADTFPTVHAIPLTRLKPKLTITNVQCQKFSPYRHDASPFSTPLSPHSAHHYQPPELHFDDPARSSLQSAMTGSSSLEPTSGTERSSILTNNTSLTDLSPYTPDCDREMTVEDALDMYLDGFSDDDDGDLLTPDLPDSPEPQESSEASGSPKSSPELASVSMSGLSSSPEKVPIVPAKDISEKQEQVKTVLRSDKKQQETAAKITVPDELSTGIPPPLSDASGLRDQYGFKKETTYISLEQYNRWYVPYSRYVGYRRQKWMELLHTSASANIDTLTFPPRSNKLKRYIRKGIPPEYRGAAWFWYAGGHEHLRQNPGLYRKLVEEAAESPMNDDKEHIERDLHRTFPDNIHFKRDSESESDDGGGSSNLEYASDTQETPMIQSLRRVLYAFSMHTPKIGYTQSLNFITGLLLLFLPEEKAFWMLHVITSHYLPGTHEVSLEGANADLWILMVALKESLPAVYTKVASPTPTTYKSRPPAITTNTRLPDITLGLTNWLMSMFIGSLPLETTLRVWDILFYEGSRTFFRVALAIFRLSQRDILAVSDPMEIFQIVQTAPKKMLDASALAEECFERRFKLTQARVEELRVARRQAIRDDRERMSFLPRPGNSVSHPSASSPESASPARAWKTWKTHTFNR